MFLNSVVKGHVLPPTCSCVGGNGIFHDFSILLCLVLCRLIQFDGLDRFQVEHFKLHIVDILVINVIQRVLS